MLCAGQGGDAVDGDEGGCSLLSWTMGFAEAADCSDLSQ